MSVLYELYRKLGNAKYGEAIGEIAPYFSTINPQFARLEPGYCEIILRNTKSVHNHIGGIHAIAICNGAELVAGLMTDVSISENHRWIPVAMRVEYLTKAMTDLRIVASGKDIDWSALGRIVVPVAAFDGTDKKVFTAEITMQVSEKKAG